MKKLNQFLQEVNQNLLYKEFKNGVFSQKQMEMPFEFSDSMFLSKKDEAKHLLASLSNMKIGYEFECYLDMDEPEYNYDTILQEDLHSIDENFRVVLKAYFDYRFNRESYNKLLFDFREWIRNSKGNQEDFNENAYDEDSDEFDDFFRTLISSERTFGNVLRKYQFSINDEYILEDNYIYISVEKGVDLENEFKLLAKVIEREFNCKVFYNSERKFSNKNSENFWYVEPDSSLNDGNPDESYFFPVEIVSKTYPAYLFKEIFYKLKNTLNEAYRQPTTNSATGLHFSVSFNDEDKNSKINLLKLVILGQDKFFLKRVGRQFNEYCESQLENVLIRIEEITESYEKPLTKEFLKEHPLTLKRIENSISKNAKFMTINFKKYRNTEGFLEFRLTGNDYFDEKEKQNLSTIEWFLYVLIASTSTTLWEDYYLSWIENYSHSIFQK